MATIVVDAVVQQLSRELLSRLDEYAHRMAERIRAHEPLYREGRVVTPEELRQSCGDNLRYVLGRLAGDIDIDTEAPRATGVPLSALLQAYRIGGRLIWDLFIENAARDHQDTLLRSAADIWAVSDDLAEVAAEAYRDVATARAIHDGQLRSALLNSLLDGKNDGARLWESAALLRLPQHGTFAVVAAECPASTHEALPGIEGLLGRHDVNSAWRLDGDLHEGVVSLRPRFDLARLCSTLAHVAPARVGVSQHETAPALRQARLACAAATPGTTDLVRFDQAPVAVLLVSAPDAAHSAARRILGPVLDLPEDDRALILGTVRSWLAASGSTSVAAARLHMHRNTVRNRLRRLEDLTGRSLANPLDLAELHVALECARTLGLA
jgi:PucR C-terminal helix-turn-helix domain